jgi:hypothetical protein
MSVKFFSIIIAVILVSITHIRADETYPNSEKCDVLVKGSVPLKDVQIVEAGDSTFTAYKEGVSKVIAYENLVRIKFRNNGFWTGAVIGGAGVFGIFAITGALYGKEAAGWGVMLGALFSLPAGLVGGLIGEFAAQDEVVDFKGLNNNLKAKRLKLLMQKHSKM